MIRRSMLMLALCGVAAAETSSLSTLAEQSNFKRTGRFEEVARLCAAYQRAWPKQVRCFEFGRTPEGRPMWALASSRDGVLTARAARERRRPVVLAQGGIHAGEIDGKDAGFMLLRDLMKGRVATRLDRLTFVFVPVFNVDGHERFGPNNRPNQAGPEEMGWRTTAQNLNLNRDYVKAETPEMQAMLRLLNEWDPLVYVDLHVTDGADFEHDISINVAPTLAGDEAMLNAGRGLRDATIQHLRASGSLPLDFYPTFIRDDDPSSGFAATVSQPRFSHEYWSRRNRIGVLVETHSWKDYKTRVRGTYEALHAMLEHVAQNGAEALRIALDLDRRSRALAGVEVALAYANTEHARMLEFRGYRYTREPSAISGGLLTRYDARQPEIWRIPLYDEVRPSVVVKAPRGGYLVPAAWAQLAASKLALHAIEFHTLRTAMTLDVETFRASSTERGAPNEGRTPLAVTGEWRDERREVPAHSIFVPIAQSNAALAVILFEPQSSDSLLTWGFFNAAFERREYMEAYVAEAVAAAMLVRDPALKAEFERRLRDDADFAASPQARLDFFYRRHPSWDERFNLYPVYRTGQTFRDGGIYR